MRKDPLPVFCFQVSLDGLGDELFFKSVGGLKMETEVIPVREGGANNTTFQLPGATKWSNIVLKQGFTKDSNASGLLKWRKEWLEPGGGRRMNGTITQLDTALQAQMSWTFVRGWPVKWELSEFDASKSELAIETLEIAHEGITTG
jgi:phage tail-like protein